MTDKELLELAAKASGIKDPLVQDFVGTCLDIRYGLSKAVWDEEEGEYWNPLEDDADAFRLMVKLGMDLTLSGKKAAVAQAGAFMTQKYCNGNPCSATRRAIVKAAAEIGKEQA